MKENERERQQKIKQILSADEYRERHKIQGRTIRKVKAEQERKTKGN